MADKPPVKPRYKRVLIKLSGEALMGDGEFGIDPGVLTRIAIEVKQMAAVGVEVSMVIGGGNMLRGAGLAAAGMDRVTADHMGMLATVINALALQDALERQRLFCRVMSAIKINQICEDYIRRRAVRHLEKGRIVVFAAGTGNPFFTTDTAAALRGVEMGANVVIKATKVDGVYTADPKKDPAATRYHKLDFNEAIARDLKVMDATALTLCRDQKLPIIVFNIFKHGALKRVVMGEDEGTLVHCS